MASGQKRSKQSSKNCGIAKVIRCDGAPSHSCNDPAKPRGVCWVGGGVGGRHGNQRAHQEAKIIRDSCDEAAAHKYTRRHENRLVNGASVRTRIRVSSRVALRRRRTVPGRSLSAISAKALPQRGV